MSVKDRDLLLLAKLAIIVIIARVIFALTYYIIFVLSPRGPLYAFDGESYSAIAWYIALVLKGVNFASVPVRHMPLDPWACSRLFSYAADFVGRLPNPSVYGVGVYSYMMGIFYFIFGYAPLLFRFLNIIVSVATTFLCYKLAKDIFDKDVARISFVLMLLIPSQFIYSASLLRDIFINFLVMISIYCILIIKQSDKIIVKVRRFIYAGIALTLLFLLRDNAALIVLISSFLYIAVILIRRYRWLSSALAVFLFAVLLISHAPLFRIFSSKIVELMNGHLRFSTYGGFTYELLPPGYYYGAGLYTISNLSPSELLFVLLKGLKTFMTEPNLFSCFKASRILALPEMVLWYGIMLFSIAGIFKSFQKIDVRVIGLLLFLLLFSLMIVLPGANVEVLIRHRGMIIPAYIIFAAYGYRMAGRKE